MKVDIIKTETIKPSTPTPQHLKTLSLSLIDQIAPPQYVSLVLFYSNDNTVSTSDQILQTLKKSLSKTLVLFYPLAGTVDLTNRVIECDDGGATFVEAEFAGPLSTFLENRYNEESQMLSFLPPEFRSLGPGVRPLLIQATFFAGGGYSLGIAVSHKLVDGATLSLFLSAWTTSASNLTVNGEAQNLTLPDFESGPLHFPAIPWLTQHLKEMEKDEKVEEKERVTRRFVFDKTAIEALKAKSASSAPRPPSRVEAVTALVWKCATSAATWQDSVLMQFVNLRTRVDPPFPVNTGGNLVSFFFAKADCDTEDFVGKLRLGFEEFLENMAKKVRGDDGKVLREWIMRGRDVLLKGNDGLVFVVWTSSWCRFGFYEVDLGFGKPAYVAGNVQSDPPTHNMLTLMDTCDGEGVEICLTLTKQEMASLECDPTFLAFVFKKSF